MSVFYTYTLFDLTARIFMIQLYLSALRFHRRLTELEQKFISRSSFFTAKVVTELSAN